MRYIGSKVKIINEIDKLITELNLGDKNFTFCDMFSGTATVGNHFKSKYKIIANDNLYFSYVISQAKLNTPNLKFEKLGKNPFNEFNSDKCLLKGFIYNNYSLGNSERMYFSEENAQRIDYIRTKIENWYISEKINDYEYYYLIASLLESVSKVANVAGVYGSYLKKWDPRAVKTMKFIPLESQVENSIFENEIYNIEAERLINDISGDILYLDPPYTKNQYSVQYHLLETIALYDNPELRGKTGARDMGKKSSNFSKTGNVHIEFEKMIARANFKHILVSYSSDGLMSKEFIESVLKRHGKIETYKCKKIEYRKYLNSKAKTGEHFEYLFYVEKKDKTTYSSPLNYIGGKADMIPFILEYSPKDCKKVVDLFGGGFNVGINFNVEQVIYNDCNFKVKELLECFKNEPTEVIYKYINSMICKYNLNKGDKEAYLKIRNLYNSTEEKKRDVKLLYLLVLYGFQQQIRFNSSYDYNNPVGQAGFNDKILEKLISFCRRLKEQNVIFFSKDFEELNEYMDSNTFVYCDPPYLLTLGSYNDGKRGFNGWEMSDEERLLNFLEKLNKNNVKFMLSNVLEFKEKENESLKKWIIDNGFKVIEYTGKTRMNRKEIIIINY